jgi:hypothetical protein
LTQGHPAKSHNPECGFFVAAKHPIQINQDAFVLNGAPNAFPGNNPISFSSTNEMPFITRSAETFLPLDVWNTAALYFVATLSPQVGSKSEPYYFDLEITWSIPEGAKPARFRVKAVATNTRPQGVASPVFSAVVEFTVEPEA